MKHCFKIAFLFFYIIGQNPCNSQIVLDTLDLPVIGDIQTSSIDDSLESVTILPGNSGPDITWDFSSMIFCCFDYVSLRWVSPEYTVNASYFPDADIALKTQCYFYHDWSTHIVTEICDNRDYYIKDSSGLKYYGSDFPQPNIVNNYRNVLPLLAYGQTTYNNSRIVVQQSADSVLVTNIRDTIIADAWGTIITPVDTCEALRIYTKETVWDSLYVNGVGSLIEYMPDNYYYKWYTKGLGFPVFQINKGIMEISKDYQIVRLAISKSYDAAVPEINQYAFGSFAFPNPALNEVKILFKNKKEFNSATLFVFGMQGNELFYKEYKSSEELIVTKNDINKGLFFYKIIFNDGTASTGKFIMN